VDDCSNNIKCPHFSLKLFYWK